MRRSRGGRPKRQEPDQFEDPLFEAISNIRIYAALALDAYRMEGKDSAEFRENMSVVDVTLAEVKRMLGGEEEKER